MKVVLFGATGMVGQGVLRECLAAPDVTEVLAVGRGPSGQTHPKLRDMVLPDMTDYKAVAPALKGFDACFFCLGISAAGRTERQYGKVTHRITLAAAKALAPLNREMTFVYLSGAGADSTEQGKVMWARVRGRTENDLLRLRFHAMYALRPGIIQPMHGERSRTASYRRLYMLLGPFLPLARKLFPDKVLTTEMMGRAMLNAVRHGAPQAILEAPDIAALSRRGIGNKAVPADPADAAAA